MNDKSTTELTCAGFSVFGTLVMQKYADVSDIEIGLHVRTVDVLACVDATGLRIQWRQINH